MPLLFDQQRVKLLALLLLVVWFLLLHALPLLFLPLLLPLLFDQQRVKLLLLLLTLLLPVLFDEHRVKLLLLPLPLSTPLLLLDQEGTELLELMLLR